MRWVMGVSTDARQVERSRLVGDGKHKEVFRVDSYAGTTDEIPEPIIAIERAKKATRADEIVKLITDFNMPRECVPTQWLNDPAVWSALLENMPATALVRNLGKMTSIGLLSPLSQASRKAVETLQDVEKLKKARVHPFTLLVAQKVYASGQGEKGKLTWTPDQNVVSALGEAFYTAFDAVEPTGKRFMLGIDVSHSMSAAICGSSLTCCEGATALALVTTHVEPWCWTGRFNTGLEGVPFTRQTRLDDALRYTRNINGGGTDCSLPMTHAMRNRIPVDTFIVLTDAETAHGPIHPSQALKQYRQAMGIPAKLVVVGMVANKFTIADASDAGMMDVVGFSTDSPAIIADFARN